ncbi:VWA domain-containing protein, partial [Francisella tularensis subsp. holarctica]|uniref:VWA domain-containing protein n=1 Tax=Francisella tularensis TaxID=263 RepID=UPI002381CD4A
ESRFDLVMRVANQFIDTRKGDRVGLILFGTRAYLQTPLTVDIATVKKMLDDASIALPGPQTDIGDAIGLAVKKIKKYPG